MGNCIKSIERTKDNHLNPTKGLCTVCFEEDVNLVKAINNIKNEHFRMTVSLHSSLKISIVILLTQVQTTLALFSHLISFLSLLLAHHGLRVVDTRSVSHACKGMFEAKSGV